jgi:hypothetical protein
MTPKIPRTKTKAEERAERDNNLHTGADFTEGAYLSKTNE